MNRLEVEALLHEARSVVSAIRKEMRPQSRGSVVVSGMLAAQLARELAAGAEADAVALRDASRLGDAEVVVHVLAGDPSSEDDELVRAADSLGIPVLLVQVWPQADKKPTFVLTPFVVECKAGKGFPLREIGARIAEAAPHPASLAGRIPQLRDAVATYVMRGTVVRAGLIGFLGGPQGSSRQLLVLEQVRMIARLGTVRGPELGARASVGLAGSAVALSFLLREVAHTAARSLPTPFGNAAVAAAGTWALGRAARRVLL